MGQCREGGDLCIRQAEEIESLKAELEAAKSTDRYTYSAHYGLEEHPEGDLIFYDEAFPKPPNGEQTDERD